ncbi:hypothetical protein ACLESO_00610 [Pyxidicoccus sp. 3LG]
MALSINNPEVARTLFQTGFQAISVEGFAENFLVYRKQSTGRWVVEARQGIPEDDLYISLGLTFGEPPGEFVGPVHRVRTLHALRLALPAIVSSLDSLASQEQQLKCPECGFWVHLIEGRNGPFLACPSVKTNSSWDGIKYKEHLRCSKRVPLRPLHNH